METETCKPEEMEVVAGTSKEERLGNCEVCSITIAKYTCPKCEVKTCCLKCSQLHKKELECDGRLDKTRYIPMKKFTNLDLSSDYRLLEEITRQIEKCKKDRRYTRKDSTQLPPHLFKLKKSSHDRKTSLKFLPPMFVRHKENSTRLNFHTDVIFWHVQWVLTNADDFKLSDRSIRETEKLGKTFSKYLTPQDNPPLQEKLQFYQSVGLSGLSFFLRAEETGGKKFYALDSTLSLKDNLVGKTIIEFPVIHVVFKEHANVMDVVDSDDEGVDVKPRVKVFKDEDICDDSIFTGLKNLLFASDQSDGEMA